MAESRGDQALGDLVRRRGHQLTGYAFLLTGDVAAAQDLVQDALVKVFLRTRKGFAPDVAEAYVRRTILSLYIDGFRRRRRWDALRPMVAVADAEAGPELATEARMDLHAALVTLAPQERAVVVLRFYEELSVAEVAEQMQLATGTVKRYLSNAMHKLQVRLGPVDGADDGTDDQADDEAAAVTALPVAGPSGSPVPGFGPHAGSLR